MDTELQGNVDQNTANQVVSDNLDLGLTPDDLGLNSEDVLADIDLDNDPDLGHDDFDDLSVREPVQQQQQNVQQQQQPTQQQQQPNQQQQRQLPSYALVKPDGKGNLVDANGQIVARAGAEARHYNKFARHFEAPLREAARRIEAGGQQVAELRGNLDKAVEIGNSLIQKVRELQSTQGQSDIAKNFGLSQDEMIQAATFARQAKNDPANAIKSILTMAAARGIDLKSVLGPNANSGIDTKSLLDLVKNEIANAVKPINDRTTVEAQREQQQRDFQAAVETIQNEARQFFNRTPDAVPFLEAFRKIKTDPNLRGLSMDHIWSEIQLRLMRMGHTPQSFMEAQRRGQQPNGGTMPNGRQRGNYVPPQQQRNVDNNSMAPVSKSYNEIVREILSAT